jgi:hypothetical protein
MSCPLLFHHYTYSRRFWDYPKWGYNSKFGSTLIMSPLLLSYKSSFLFQNVGQSHDALCMCKIVRDSVTCIVKLMDDLNIFCKTYLGNQPIFHIFIAPIKKLQDYSSIWITIFYTIHKSFYGTSKNSLHLSVNNYNSRFLLSLCLLILCWKVSEEFSRNQIWHTKSIIRRALLFYMK